MAVTKTAAELERDGYELISRGNACLAEAARLRAVCERGSDDLVDVASLPIPKRAAFNAARSGALRAAKVGRRWLARRSDVEAFIAEQAKTARPANDTDHTNHDDDVRASLGLVSRPTKRAS